MSSSTPYTIIGTPFSTFTRTITLGFHYKGLEFEQVRTAPHTDIAYEHHPFGYLPTVVIREVDGKPVNPVKLRESQAIVRFLDRVAPEPSLHVKPGEGRVIIEEQMWELVSFIACWGFPLIEGGVIKPRIKAMDEGTLSESAIREQISDGVAKMKEFFTLVESLISHHQEDYAFTSDHPSWADFFLYPLLSDLSAVHEYENVSPRLVAWKNKMDELPAVKATAAGTLSVGARPW